MGCLALVFKNRQPIRSVECICGLAALVAWVCITRLLPELGFGKPEVESANPKP